MTRFLFIWHRRLALLLLIPVLSFSLSGLLHPMMRLTRPEAVKMFYPQPVWPADLQGPLIVGSTPEVSGVRPVKVGDTWLQQQWYSRKERAEFFDLQTGHLVAGAAQTYAEQLARHFAGDNESALDNIQLVTHFDNEYGAINRLLPVWRVDFDRDDGLSIYVDIRQDRLATVTDDTRRALMQLFRWLHVWTFMEEDSLLRNVLFLGMMVASTVLAVSGIYLFVVLPLRKRKNATARKVHVWGGALISVAMLAFVLSGLARSVEKLLPEIRGINVDQRMELTQLKHGFADLQRENPGIQNAHLHRLDGELVWQVSQARQPDRWFGNGGMALPEGGIHYALQIATVGLSTQESPVSTAVVTSFKMDDDYGFIDKRLPVVLLQFPDQSVYIDTRDGVISKQVTESSRAFNWVFRYLHKWRFADGLTLNGRDALMAVFILSISLISLLGAVIWYTRRRKQSQARKLNIEMA